MTVRLPRRFERAMHTQSLPEQSTTVVVVGPPADVVGGMATVCGQMASLDFAGRYRLIFAPFTLGSCATEPAPRRAVRHFRQLWRLVRMLLRVRGSIVHLHTCSGFSFYRSALDAFAARMLGGKTILHVHGAMFDAFYEREPRWRKRVIRRMLTAADRVIALSDSWRQRLLMMAPAANIIVIENAVGATPDESRTVGMDACHFVLLARLDEWKGVDDLLDASARLHADGVEFRLTLAGPEGTAGDAPTIRRKIAVRGLTGCVTYVGCVRDQRKAELLRSADVYVQPSHHEGMPMAMLEALMFGLPVVATRVGAIGEVIEDGRQGVLVSPHDPAALAGAMRRLVENAGERREMAVRARTLAASRFGLARLRDDLARLYGELVSRPISTTKSFAEDRSSPTHRVEPVAGFVQQV